MKCQFLRCLEYQICNKLRLRKAASGKTVQSGKCPACKDERPVGGGGVLCRAAGQSTDTNMRSLLVCSTTLTQTDFTRHNVW